MEMRLRVFRLGTKKLIVVFFSILFSINVSGQLSTQLTMEEQADKIFKEFSEVNDTVVSFGQFLISEQSQDEHTSVERFYIAYKYLYRWNLFEVTRKKKLNNVTFITTSPFQLEDDCDLDWLISHNLISLKNELKGRMFIPEFYQKKDTLLLPYKGDAYFEVKLHVNGNYYRAFLEHNTLTSTLLWDRYPMYNAPQKLDR